MMMEDFSSTQLRAFIRYEYDGVTLDLRLKGLSNFPDAVTELSELEVLRLNGNNLTELPTSINKLKNLKRLYLHNNKLSKVPVAVTELSELEELWLSGNNLTELPTSINKLKNLKRLDLTDNKLSKVPDAVTELSELKDLWLNDNNLTELPTSIGEMKELRMLSVPHNPFTIDGMRSLLKLKEKKKEKIFIDITVPAEIEARGPRAQLAYQNALRDGAVRVYHGRLLLIGQDRAGKTSLKKSLLGQPFEPKEQSTEGIEVDPSTFQVDVDNVKNWQSIDENKQWLLGCFKDVARMVVEKLRVPDKLWDREEKDREKDDEQNIDNEAEKEEDDSFMNQVADPKIDTDSVSEHTSAQPELMVDTTSPPDEITKHAIQLIKYVKGKRVKEESVVSMEVWDFAGQHLYYASHPIFFSPRAIYILVFNLSKSLNATAQPCVRQGTCNIILDNPNEETNMENLQSWLSTVHSITPMSRETNDNAQRKLPHLHPPVFIVGTHADKPFEDIRTMKSEIQGRIAGKEYEGHVVRPIFSIDNTARLLGSRIKNVFRRTDENIDAIQALQNKIMEVLRQESYMGEKIPVRWLNFEKIIDALLSKQIFHVNVKQLQTYAKDVCFITDKEEFITMLNFYHDLGMIIKHHSTVILKAQWLIDLFRQLITIPHFNKADREVSKHWKEVEDTGVLHMELVDHVFEKFLLKGVVRDDILNMMEQFGLIAKYSPSTTDVKYFVPAQLKAPPDSICAMMPSSSDPCPLYVYFVGGFVPHGLFTQLVSHFIRWCSEVGPTQPPTLYRNGAWFVIGRQVVHDFILTCKKQFIKVVLKQRSQSQPVVGDKSTDHEVAVQVREFVDGTLQSLSRDLPYLRGLQYKFHVECPYCKLDSKKCTNHSEESCAHEDCLHLLEITQGNPLICKKKPSNAVLRVDGLEKWFPNGPAKVSRHEEPATTAKVMDDIQLTQVRQIFNLLLQMKWDAKAKQSKGTSNTDLSLGLKKIALGKGFLISNNEGGGNCMFHALSEQLDLVKGIQISHQELRHKVVNYLTKNPTLPDGTELINFVDGYSSWNAYLTYMAADGTWGDHVILHGVANCFETSIHVISNLSHRNDVIINPVHAVTNSNPLVLGHVHELHYVSLIPPKPADSEKRRKRKQLCEEDDAASQMTSEDQPTQGPAKVSRHEEPATTAKVMDDIQLTQVKEGCPCDDELEELSERIGNTWKKLGRRLKFDEAKLTGFHKDNEEYSEKAYAMLMAWKRKEGLGATYQVLHQALCHKFVNRRDLAVEICCKHD